MIKVCDSIMGSGKSSAAIRYMNSNPTEKFIYITPYLKEADRIKGACPNCNFVRPNDNIPEYSFSVRNHTAALIQEGRSVASTHQAFKFYTPEMLDDIREQGYTLVIDENIEMLEELQFGVGDVTTLTNAGYIERVDNEIRMKSDTYTGKIAEYRQFFALLRGRNLMCLNDESTGTLYYWMLPPELFTAFKDVIIMTYMFAGQEVHHFLELNNLKYEYIYIGKDDDGFYFSSTPSYFPAYARHLRDKIHILDDKKMNEIGEAEHAISSNWCQRSSNKAAISQLKNNIFNFFTHIVKAPSNQRMWSCYSTVKNALKGNGYTKSFVSFNERATNEYRNKTVLAYPVNVYMNVPKKLYFQSRGIDVNEDVYALSVIVQWVWRSAIRDGMDIYVYIPSKRMRTLLVNWMDELAKGGAH